MFWNIKANFATMESTEPTMSPETSADQIEVPIYGLPGYLFNLIHVTALIVLPISVLISAGVLIYLLRPIQEFFTRSIGDRLIVYLAVCDLLYSASHILDHAYMIAIRDHPPDVACAAFGFLLNEFVLAQSLVVIFAALNAFALVVLNKRMNTGKYDWRLILVALGIPTILGILGLSTGYFGPTGPWCYINLRKPLGAILGNIATIVMLITSVFTVACYAGVWLKIRQTTRSQKGHNKYIRTARVMMLFVAAYILQWWAYVTFATWSLFSQPHPVITWGGVFFSNLGGLFNFLAYTFIRKKYQTVGTNTGQVSKVETNTSQT